MNRDAILARNHVRLRGVDGTALVFGHGFGCDQRVWRKVQPAFEDDYRCILFDYVGAGRSDRRAYDPKRYSSLTGYARDLIEIGEALGLEKATFVGHSVSAMIGVIASVEVRHLFDQMVLLAPSPRYLNDPPYVGGFELDDVQALFELMDQNFMGWATSFAELAAHDADAARELTDNFSSTDRATARQFAEATFYCDHRQDLAKVQARCLVIQCSDDDIAPASVGRYVAEQLPNCQMKLLDASGHLPHLTHASQTISLIRDFLRRETAV